MTTLLGTSFDEIRVGNKYLDRCGNTVVINLHEESNDFNRFGGNTGRIYKIDGSCTPEVLYDLIDCVEDNSKNGFPLKTCKGLWFPISELTNKYIEAPLLIASPKLVHPDYNPEGISTAHWRDDKGWIANDWDMNNDEHVKIVLTEEDVTHFLYVEGPYKKDDKGYVIC
jgi:hypothetical protein